ncbi:30S RIBOSOMAL PROTEIN 3 CHLOROPLAST putative-RELATED [Salix koriyanagi]|uniref:30S RIBOSOMAL PROTEIN 3 CHLOROPLAST putative-RELATED n=1 Tax=Salix koriyanagi TaxID=2511006 RepID=A0A9Q0WKM1_9ROSI|nr:30S RIBOSOMAL PROTEIN 3 CHLOROPLAST putative-RELATED [Salix koriyanagi]
MRTNSTLYVSTESLKLLIPYLGPDTVYLSKTQRRCYPWDFNLVSTTRSHVIHCLAKSPSCKTFKATISINPKPNRIRSSTFFDRNRRHVSRNHRYTAFAVPEAPAAETPADAPPFNAAEESIPIQETEKKELVVKQLEKPRLVLKFVWMEKNIGLALDQATDIINLWQQSGGMIES